MTADKMPEIHLECRFSDGQKYAAVMVDIECPSLADFLAKAINTRTDLPDPRLEILAAALRGFVLYDGQISHCGFRPEIEAAKKALRDTNLGG